MTQENVSSTPVIGLFVTCLVDLFRPSVGFAAVKLLERAGFTVEIPRAQTCCGQPAYNSGDNDTARILARGIIDAFEHYDYVIAPSGSCAAMIKHHFPILFAADSTQEKRARQLAEKTYELVSFLSEIADIELDHEIAARATYHDACSGLRELGIHSAPRRLLQQIKGLEIVEMTDADHCCGFGGTFCVKFPDISNEMVSRKTGRIAETGADLVLAGDLGCLMNLAGKLSRDGAPTRARHIAEVLADELSAPAIGEPQERRSR